MENKTILIAGGTGFIGTALIKLLQQHHTVRILSRNRSRLGKEYYYWNPEKQEIDLTALLNVTHIINLCGAGIADKRWTKSRKKELRDSRVIPAQFLYSLVKKMDQLEHYITASGINCYDVVSTKVYTENDPMANDFVSNLVREWEENALLFETKCKVSIIRTSFVISSHGGGLSKIEKPIQMGFGTVFGSGKQALPWIHLDDLICLFEFVINQQLRGVYHAVADNTTQKELTLILAKKNNKRICLPPVPGFILKLILGELSSLILTGIQASNDKIKKQGFNFQRETLVSCF